MRQARLFGVSDECEFAPTRVIADVLTSQMLAARDSFQCAGGVYWLIERKDGNPVRRAEFRKVDGEGLWIIHHPEWGNPPLPPHVEDPAAATLIRVAGMPEDAARRAVRSAFHHSWLAYKKACKELREAKTRGGKAWTPVYHGRRYVHNKST